MEKVCTGCKILKSLDDYGNDRKAFDGKNQKCKQCCNERAKKTVHSEQAIKKQKVYRSEWQKKKRPILNARLRERYLRNIESEREKSRERTRKYLQSEKGRKKHIQATREYERKNPEKIRAQRSVRRAIKSGKLIRPIHCEICNKEGNIHAHHEDYNKPLEVIWMCSRCHLYHHQGSRFHAERLNESASKEDAIVRSEEETFRDRQK